jgi:glutaredoxin-related protein
METWDECCVIFYFKAADNSPQVFFTKALIQVLNYITIFNKANFRAGRNVLYLVSGLAAGC